MIKVYKDMEDFSNLCIQVQDILECRVENVLESISITSLCEAPMDPITIDDFLKITEETVHKATVTLSKYEAIN
jgi:dynein heavy chain